MLDPSHAEGTAVHLGSQGVGNGEGNCRSSVLPVTCPHDDHFTSSWDAFFSAAQDIGIWETARLSISPGSQCKDLVWEP